MIDSIYAFHNFYKVELLLWLRVCVASSFRSKFFPLLVDSHLYFYTFEALKIFSIVSDCKNVSMKYFNSNSEMTHLYI